MTLDEYLHEQGHGSMRRMQAATGLGYQALWRARRGWRIRYETAKKIAMATGGVVSITSLVEAPRRVG